MGDKVRLVGVITDYSGQVARVVQVVQVVRVDGRSRKVENRTLFW